MNYSGKTCNQSRNRVRTFFDRKFISGRKRGCTKNWLSFGRWPSFTLVGQGGSFAHIKKLLWRSFETWLDASPLTRSWLKRPCQDGKSTNWNCCATKMTMWSSSVLLKKPQINEGFIQVIVSQLLPAMTLSDTAFSKDAKSSNPDDAVYGAFLGELQCPICLKSIDEQIIAIEINPVFPVPQLWLVRTGYPSLRLQPNWHWDIPWMNWKTKLQGLPVFFFGLSTDYVIVKMPRWNFEKFHGADSVWVFRWSCGWSHGIGRSFFWSIAKACQSQENDRAGLMLTKEWINTQDILERTEKVSDDRIYRVKECFASRCSGKNTQADPHWSLVFKKLKKLAQLEEQVQKLNVPEDIGSIFCFNSSKMVILMLKLAAHEVGWKRYHQLSKKLNLSSPNTNS